MHKNESVSNNDRFLKSILWVILIWRQDWGISYKILYCYWSPGDSDRSYKYVKMEMCLAFRCLALVSFASHITSCPSDDRCHGQTFIELSNRSYAGGVLLREGPWPVRKCRM